MNTKIERAMRSMYRFRELIEMGSPSILIDFERGILRRYLGELEEGEILEMMEGWGRYVEESRVKGEMEGREMFEEIERDLLRMN